jgi:hypothetical protein
MSPICPCGSTEMPEEMPWCGRRDCLRRWWVRFAAPVALLIVAIVAIGVATNPDPGYTCADGWTDLGGGACVNRQ